MSAQTFALLGRSALSDMEIGRVAVRYVYFVECNGVLTAGEKVVLRELLAAADDFPPAADGSVGGCSLIIPHFGIASPWGSKAADIVHRCGLSAVCRLERGWLVLPGDGGGDNTAVAAAKIADRMTQTVLSGDKINDWRRLFAVAAAAPLQTVALNNDAAVLQKINRDWGLSLADNEIAHLLAVYGREKRDPTDAEILMFAQANSEHCRHKIFNSPWRDGGDSLMSKIVQTHDNNPAEVIVAFHDNAAIINGGRGIVFAPDDDGVYRRRDEDIYLVAKAETHNHPTAICPFPGAATGCGGEIRDEVAAGRGAASRAGFCGFAVSNLGRDVCGKMPAVPTPRHIASPLQIMTDGPIGAASFNNEFGRPSLAGFFRCFESVESLSAESPSTESPSTESLSAESPSVESPSTESSSADSSQPSSAQNSVAINYGFHKPIMLAGGLGQIRPVSAIKKELPPGAKIIHLGGPGFRIGMGGGSASSRGQDGDGGKLDFASVQRDNAEMQRRVQQVIDTCRHVADGGALLSLHDVGAGGLANATAELANNGGRGAVIYLDDAPVQDKSLSPAEIWCNESQERYVAAILPTAVEAFAAVCRRESCPLAVIGEITEKKRLIVFSGRQKVVDLPMEDILGKLPLPPLEYAGNSSTGNNSQVEVKGDSRNQGNDHGSDSRRRENNHGSDSDSAKNGRGLDSGPGINDHGSDSADSLTPRRAAGGVKICASKFSGGGDSKRDESAPQNESSFLRRRESVSGESSATATPQNSRGEFYLPPQAAEGENDLAARGESDLTVAGENLAGDENDLAAAGDDSLAVMVGNSSAGGDLSGGVNFADIILSEIIYKVLRHPSVASKNFLITIGDRTVGGLTARDQLVGPWQTPVADCAAFFNDYHGFGGAFFALGEKPAVAVANPAAAVRMAIAESLTNLAAADVQLLSRVKLSLNWMANCENASRTAVLRDAVFAAAEFCKQLNIGVVVGKDSLSMRQMSKMGTVESPPLAVSAAFVAHPDVRRHLTPQFGDDDSFLFLATVNRRRRLGRSIFCQVGGAAVDEVPDVCAAAFLDFWRALMACHRQNFLLAYHDVSDGGLWATVCEMCFAANRGAVLTLDGIAETPTDTDDNVAVGGREKLFSILFNEEIAVVLQVAKKHAPAVLDLFAKNNLAKNIQSIGYPVGEKKLTMYYDGKKIAAEKLSTLRREWTATSYKIARRRDNAACADEEQRRDMDGDGGLFARLPFVWGGGAPTIGGARPRAAILREQGVNGHREMAAAFDLAGFAAVDVTVGDLLDGRRLDYRLLAMGGGFSFGDVLGAGRGMAMSVLHHPKLAELFRDFFHSPSTLSLGVCNGCQSLAMLQALMPDAASWQFPRFLQNTSRRFEARLLMTEILPSPSPLFGDMAGAFLPVACSHGEGRRVFANDKKRAPTMMRFTDNDGRATESYPFNPNGSGGGETAFCSPCGRINIVMPHPERVFRTAQFSWSPKQKGDFSPWLKIFTNARRFYE